MNRVFLSGRVVKKPEIELTSTGKGVVEFTLAVYRTKDVADFIRLQAWEKSAETIVTYTDKGSLINIEAHISTRKYENKEGKTVFVTEHIVDRVELLSKKPEEQNSTKTYSTEAPKAASTQQETTEPYKPYFPENEDGFNTGPLIDIAADDLPF